LDWSGAEIINLSGFSPQTVLAAIVTGRNLKKLGHRRFAAFDVHRSQTERAFGAIKNEL
jgi:hypothetical protein